MLSLILITVHTTLYHHCKQTFYFPRDIIDRKNRRLARSPRQNIVTTNAEEIPMVMVKPAVILDDPEAGASSCSQIIRLPQNSAVTTAVAATTAPVPITPPVQIVINEATSINPQPSVSEGASSGQSVKSLKKTNCSVKKARQMNVVGRGSSERTRIFCPKFPLTVKKKAKDGSLVGGNEPTENGGNTLTTLSPNSHVHKQKKKDIRRKNEDSLAVVFMIIILIFLVCHAPRIILDINELATIKMSEYCASVGSFQYSFWSILLLNVSHFLLVVNSSVNMIVYCLLGSRFRAEVRKIFDSFVCYITTIQAEQ